MRSRVSVNHKTQAGIGKPVDAVILKYMKITFKYTVVQNFNVDYTIEATIKDEKVKFIKIFNSAGERKEFPLELWNKLKKYAQEVYELEAYDTIEE